MRERSHLQRLAALERDAAVARAGRVRRWAIAGTAALTAGFAGLVAAIAPGKSLGAKHSTVPSRSTISSRTSSASSAPAIPMPPLESPSQLGLQGPDQAPQAAPQPPAQSTPGSPASAQSAPAPGQSAPAPSSPQDGGGGPPVSGGS